MFVLARGSVKASRSPCSPLQLSQGSRHNSGTQHADFATQPVETMHSVVRLMQSLPWRRRIDNAAQHSKTTRISASKSTMGLQALLVLLRSTTPLRSNRATKNTPRLSVATQGRHNKGTASGNRVSQTTQHLWQILREYYVLCFCRDFLLNPDLSR